MDEVLREQEVMAAVSTCTDIIRLGFARDNGATVNQALIALLLINLNDLLQKMDADGARLTFADDIHPACKAADVTQLINNARNSACHLNSGNAKWGANRFMSVVLRGKGKAINTCGVDMSGEYEDDIAFLFGANRVYLSRHIRRALHASIDHFAKTLKRFGGAVGSLQQPYP